MPLLRGMIIPAYFSFMLGSIARSETLFLNCRNQRFDRWSTSVIEIFQKEPGSLAAGDATLHLEVAGLRPATAESQFIGAISPVFKIAFNMVEYDIAGQSLFA
jgi:hypothetical protein